MLNCTLRERTENHNSLVISDFGYIRNRSFYFLASDASLKMGGLETNKDLKLTVFGEGLKPL